MKTESERAFSIYPYQWLSNLYQDLAEVYLKKSDNQSYKYYLNKFKDITLEGIRKSEGTYVPLYARLASYYQHLLDNCDNCDESDLREKMLLAKEKIIEINPEIRFLGEDYINRSDYTGYGLPPKIVFLNRDHGWSTTKFKILIANSIK